MYSGDETGSHDVPEPIWAIGSVFVELAPSRIDTRSSVITSNGPISIDDSSSLPPTVGSDEGICIPGISSIFGVGVAVCMLGASAIRCLGVAVGEGEGDGCSRRNPVSMFWAKGRAFPTASVQINPAAAINTSKVVPGNEILMITCLEGKRRHRPQLEAAGRSTQSVRAAMRA